MFYLILKDLAKYFHLYVVDLLGMGSSGRPPYSAANVENAENFFVDSLKIWYDKVGINKKVYLCGHSFGGYISTVFTLRYPEVVERLLLLSPVGIPERPAEFNPENIVKSFNKFYQRWGAKVILNLWDKSFTPFNVLRIGGSVGTSTFLSIYMKIKMGKI